MLQAIGVGELRNSSFIVVTLRVINTSQLMSNLITKITQASIENQWFVMVKYDGEIFVKYFETLRKKGCPMKINIFWISIALYANMFSQKWVLMWRRDVSRYHFLTRF